METGIIDNCVYLPAIRGHSPQIRSLNASHLTGRGTPPRPQAALIIIIHQIHDKAFSRQAHHVGLAHVGRSGGRRARRASCPSRRRWRGCPTGRGAGSCGRIRRYRSGRIRGASFAAQGLEIFILPLSGAHPQDPSRDMYVSMYVCMYV
jgi:hypothetical protein